MFRAHILLTSILFILSSAWNTDVHNQIGFMAEAFFEPTTTEILSQILEPEYNDSVGRAAAWADHYAHTSEGRFSYPWHWIDTHDQAPEYCYLDYQDDCSRDGCVVSAIINQTRILRECIRETRADKRERGNNVTCSQALKWVAHFLGDVHQPLHNSGKDVGGNTYKVIFANQTTQLHKVWDGDIPYFAANVSQPFSNQSIDPFFSSLVSRIRHDEFYSSPYLWLACSDPSTPEICATTWARESNRWNCDYVWSRVTNDTDLRTNGYAVGAVPIVELQISKAAVRLGAWLNRLVEETEEANEFPEL